MQPIPFEKPTMNCTMNNLGFFFLPDNEFIILGVFDWFFSALLFGMFVYFMKIFFFLFKLFNFFFKLLNLQNVCRLLYLPLLNPLYTARMLYLCVLAYTTISSHSFERVLEEVWIFQSLFSKITWIIKFRLSKSEYSIWLVITKFVTFPVEKRFR